MRAILLTPSVGIGLLLILAGSSVAFARAGHAGHDDPWNSEHIDNLPAEVKDAVIRMCGPAAHAGHYFVTYLDHSRLIKLHFEYLHCADDVRFCRQGGCLRHEYAETAGRYRLIRAYYGGND